MIEYKENEDYLLENGQLLRTPNSRMPALDYDGYYLCAPSSIPIASSRVPGRYVRFEPGGFFHTKQVAVTYRHSGVWEDVLPRCVKDRLPESFRRLEMGQELRIVLYGDSIMEGCDASGYCRIAPYLPAFPSLFVDALRHKFPGSRIAAINTAVGGTDSRWGAEQAAQRGASVRPDLVLINFGMNDSGRPVLPEEYRQNLLRIIETFRAENPRAEFLLLTPGVANPDCTGWTVWQRSYRSELAEIEAATPGVAVVRLGELLEAVLRRKRYADITGNCVNHPNDFMSRIYAQFLIGSFCE